jgi:hypothetical protein
MGAYTIMIKKRCKTCGTIYESFAEYCNTCESDGHLVPFNLPSPAKPKKERFLTFSMLLSHVVSLFAILMLWGMGFHQIAGPAMVILTAAWVAATLLIIRKSLR